MTNTNCNLIDTSSITIREALAKKMTFNIIVVSFDSDTEDPSFDYYVNSKAEIESFDFGAGGYDLLENMSLFPDSTSAKDFIAKNKNRLLNSIKSYDIDNKNNITYEVFEFRLDEETILKYNHNLDDCIGELSNLNIEWL